jgi:hypothetical protein
VVFVIGAVTKDAVGASIDYGAKNLMEGDSSLTVKEARVLSGGALLGTTVLAQGTAGIKQILRHVNKPRGFKVTTASAYVSTNEIAPKTKNIVGSRTAAKVDDIKLRRDGVKQPLYSNDPYLESKLGGIHNGQYNKFVKQDVKQLQKSIKSFNKNIKKHEWYIQNPKSHVHNWDSLPVERQEYYKRHWNNDIARAKEFKHIAEQVLKNKQ